MGALVTNVVTRLPLPRAARETASLSSSYGTNVLTGPNASCRQFKSVTAYQRHPVWVEKAAIFWVAAFFHGAPGRAHLLGGESPLLARQGEELAEGKGFAGDCESEGSWMAKRWPDEQEADMRRCIGVRWPYSSKPETCTERCGVDPTGISVKVGAQYPGRSGRVPERATGTER